MTSGTNQGYVVFRAASASTRRDRLCGSAFDSDEIRLTPAGGLLRPRRRDVERLSRHRGALRDLQLPPRPRLPRRPSAHRRNSAELGGLAAPAQWCARPARLRTGSTSSGPATSRACHRRCARGHRLRREPASVAWWRVTTTYGLGARGAMVSRLRHHHPDDSTRS